jgi:DNA-binding transcriptional ArsR family regulator
MVPASLSTEGRIISNLAALQMSRKEFVGICRSLSIPISEALVSLVLSGKRIFSQWTGMALRSVMDELKSLRDHHGVALNWSSSEEIATRLVQRRMQLAELKEEVTA